MRTRRLLPVLATLLLAASALAQFTIEQKNTVLEQVDRILTREAFVPGVDLMKWRDFVKAREDRLAETETPSEFADVINGAFQQFGLSHIQLVRDRRRAWGELSLLQGWRGSRAPTYRWVEQEKIALVRLPSFTAGYDEEAVEAIFAEIGRARGMILDLRGNPGGEVENMRHFLGMLLPPDTSVGTFVSRRLADEYSRSERRPTDDPVAIAKWAHRNFKPRKTPMEPFAGQIAVLLDAGSASASEIVANALRESRRSTLVGSPTAGAVLVSTFGRLSYGFRIQYPVGDYVSAEGRRLEGNPLIPDVRVSASRAFDAALSALTRRDQPTRRLDPSPGDRTGGGGPSLRAR